MTWTEWIKQYPKLEEYWQMIPEPANTLFRQQIDNYANKVADDRFKNITSSDDGKKSNFRPCIDCLNFKNCVNSDKCLYAG